ncbi:MAG: PVC-type heme-binding CxxCH protein [Rubripirellula sp.]
MRARSCLAICFFAAATAAFLSSPATAAEPKHILMVAGRPSHGYGAHEHYAGLKILEESIRASSDDVETTVVRGWPEDASLIEKADTIVIYSDGGGRHVAIEHLDAIREKMNAGCGLVCLHYAVEMVPGPPGDAMVDLLGGHFEINYSVNPHWIGDFKSLPEHPVSRGVNPFATNDEWYFHLRFNEDGNVTPILAAVAPEDTMRRADGEHSGNPSVRKSVAAGEMQTVAWTYDRPAGGRAFGLTGGHFHWNWGHDDMRRLVVNAIRWTAGEDIAKSGSSMGQPVSIDELLENQDFDRPENFNSDKIKEEFKLGAASNSSTKSNRKVGRSSGPKPRILFESPLVTSMTPGDRVEIETSVKGVKDLYLVVTDGGDGYSCDWADWIDPQLRRGDNTQLLTDMKWKSAATGFGKVHQAANCVGQPWSVEGETVGSTAIGVHANSVIHYELPGDFETFTVTAALDTGGTNQNGGKDSSVKFVVYADAAPELAGEAAVSPKDQREPAFALDGLQIAEGLEVTLSASEPVLRSLTNLDIDDRGRVWVCDVMNYRKNNGARPEGDRILILEDTTGDGVMDSSKTFYQGRDIDSAMGICVLGGPNGNEVIVSASPTIWRFIDEDGDDIPDRKEAMFTETGMPQHDHSAHSFFAGPDGKLYWNFGNTGQQVKDENGQTVVDIHGRPVVDDGKPLFGGMPFRCDLDGSNFEVLAHNFRNNWETTVDSFGTLWQSDNDDDGNQGVRINFVMEQGNYGYRDEITGAGWRDDRMNIEQEIPFRHWHLNDPGVVPNMLQTGAGSPSGICVYEGRLLPERFWDQIIHCDPGPNVVRAYPTSADGAGYSATIEPLVTGTTDKWFRPADVCVAPDGSLFVTDWYDPGVGGHAQGDTDRGRLFRIAPPGSTYQTPKFDYSTVAGACSALRNPNLAVRYKAYQAILAMGNAAEADLYELYQDPNPRIAARALWLLGRIEGAGAKYVQKALEHSNADIRITAIRLAKELKLTPSAAFASVVSDPSAAVRRELATTLRYDESAAMPATWAKLAMQYDGSDRWYLEALGIGSELRSAECFDAWLDAVGDDWNSPAGQDIVWRTRAPKAAALMAKLIADPSMELAATDRLFRSLEYHDAATRTAAMKSLLALESGSDRDDAIIVRAIERMDGFDASADRRAKSAIDRQLDRTRGTVAYLDLVKRFNPAGMQDSLLDLLGSDVDDSTKVEAASMLGETENGPMVLRKSLASESVAEASNVARVLGLLGNGRAMNMLSDTAANADRAFDVRKEAVVGLSRSKDGQGRLISLATEGKLPADTQLLAGGLLARSEDESIRKQAAECLPQITQKDSKPLSPIDQLATMRGDVDNGMKLFRGVGTCANCHIVKQFGKSVGPDLSEIGSKLSREAMFTSILAPSAGISHNYETYNLLTAGGQVFNGLLISETPEEVTIRTVDAIDRKIKQDDIELLKKAEKSIMPDNLHHTMDQQGLVDVVEYLMSLTKTGT